MIEGARYSDGKALSVYECLEAEMGTIWGNPQYYCCIAIYCQDNNISSARSNTIQYNIDLVIEQYIAISYNVGSDGSRDPKLAGLGSFI